MKTFRPILITCLPLLCAIAANATTPLAWFKLDEGSIDANTNTVYDTQSANTGTLSVAPGGSGNGTIQWVTTGLANIPTPGTTAALQLTALTPTGSTGNPKVVTTIVAQDDTGNALAGKRARTFTAWIQPAASQNDANATIINLGGTLSGSSGRRATFKLTAGSGGYVIRGEFQGGGINGTKNVADGNWHHVVMVMPANGTVGNVVLYVDGVVDPISASSGLAVSIDIQTNAPLIIGATTNLVGDRGFTGLIDDTRVYTNALTASDVVNLYLGSGVAPSLTQVANQSFVIGSTNSSITLNAGAVGTPPLQIQWKFNGVNILNATNDALTLYPVVIGNAGLYTVAVTNAYGGVSSNALLSLNTAPINPPRQAVLTGGSANFSVTMPADSTGYTYQWRTNGVDIAGATGSTLTVNSASAANAGTNYQVVVDLERQLSHQRAASQPECVARAFIALLANRAGRWSGRFLAAG